MDGRENDYKWAGPYMVSRQVVAVNENSNLLSRKKIYKKCHRFSIPMACRYREKLPFLLAVECFLCLYQIIQVI